MNIHEKEMCIKLVIYKDYTEMHGQQNLKLHSVKSVLSPCDMRQSNTRASKASG